MSTPPDFPTRIIDPTELALGLAYLDNGRPCLALVIDRRVAVRLPDESLDELERQLRVARDELARMAPMRDELS